MKKTITILPFIVTKVFFQREVFSGIYHLGTLPILYFRENTSASREVGTTCFQMLSDAGLYHLTLVKGVLHTVNSHANTRKPIFHFKLSKKQHSFPRPRSRVFEFIVSVKINLNWKLKWYLLKTRWGIHLNSKRPPYTSLNNLHNMSQF